MCGIICGIAILYLGICGLFFENAHESLAEIFNKWEASQKAIKFMDYLIRKPKSWDPKRLKWWEQGRRS